MFDKTKLIDDIMSDWSYRVSDGKPDVNNYEHRVILKNILKEQDVPNDAITMIIQNLAYEKQILQEVDSMRSITGTAIYNRGKTHMTGSGYSTYYDPSQMQNILPTQDSEEEEEELEDDGQSTTAIETYKFDKEQMMIVETGDTISIDDVLVENKFKCFMTGEVYCETKNGMLVKENDIINEIEFGDEDEFKKYKSQHKMRDTTVVTVGGKETTAGDVGKEKKDSPQDKDSENIIDGKNKSLKKINTLKTENFNKQLSPPSNDFDKNNKQYFNAEPPPHFKFSNTLKTNIKIPKHYTELLERFINTKSIKSTPTQKLSYFVDSAGGAGTINSQAGELISLLFTTLDEEEFSSLYNELNNHVNETKQQGNQILTSDWIKGAVGNRQVIKNQISNKFPEGTKIIAGAWDNQNDVEALGLSDYKNNKGFTSDVYYKLQLPDGKIKLYEVTLKQSLNANLLNSRVGKLLKWNPNIDDSINPKVFTVRERTMIVNGADKLKKSINELDKLLKSNKTVNMTEDMKTFLDAQKTKKYSFDEALEKAKKSPSRGDMKVIYYGIKALADNGDKNAIKIVDTYYTMYRQYQSDSLKAMAGDEKLKEGLLNDIKQEFPLKSITNKEENMAVGNQSLDSIIVKEIFGTEDFDKIKEQLTTEIDSKGNPYLAYRVKVEAGKEEKIIPIAGIKIRSNGIGYAGPDIKFEMSLHNDFKKLIKDANKKIYNT